MNAVEPRTNHEPGKGRPSRRERPLPELPTPDVLGAHRDDGQREPDAYRDRGVGEQERRCQARRPSRNTSGGPGPRVRRPAPRGRGKRSRTSRPASTSRGPARSRSRRRTSTPSPRSTRRVARAEGDREGRRETEEEKVHDRQQREQPELREPGDNERKPRRPQARENRLAGPEKAVADPVVRVGSHVRIAPVQIRHDERSEHRERPGNPEEHQARQAGRRSARVPIRGREITGRRRRTGRRSASGSPEGCGTPCSARRRCPSRPPRTRRR